MAWGCAAAGREGVLGFGLFKGQRFLALGWKAAAPLALTAWLAGCAGPRRPAALARPPSTASPVSFEHAVAHLPLAPPPHADLVPPASPRLDVLIALVKREIHAGEVAYQSGNLAEARQHFDTATNRLMASGLNFSVDPRLEPLMDQLINAMHEFEVKTGSSAGGAAVAPGQEQEAEQGTEPASPLEEIAAAANLPANPEVNQKAASELLLVPHDLPLTVNEPVLTFLNFFETPRGRAIIAHSLARSGRYMAMVSQVLRQKGLPQDLKYLPLPESGYQPRALSRMRALGLWQFTAASGRLYGLKMDRWEDQRMDPVKSTEAAAEYLRDLYGIFHDWYLVLAAYDSGPLTVARAIARTGYADFWQLYRLNALPLETKNYVPIMLAMTLVAKDPSLYGVDVADPEAPEKTDAFAPGRSLDLRLAADAIGVKTDVLRNLNPELRGDVTPDDPGFVLRVPVGTATPLLAALGAIPASHWVGWRLHRVGPDDTLGAIARQYHVAAGAIAAANDLSADSSLASGTLLLVPAPLGPTALFYRVRAGDTLGRIAGHYRVSVSQLRLWNHLRSNLIRERQVLRIYARERAASEYEVASGPVARRRGRSRAGEKLRGRSGEIHVARSGDTLWAIARRYGVTLGALRAVNPGIVRRGLKAGEHVVIP